MNEAVSVSPRSGDPIRRLLSRLSDEFLLGRRLADTENRAFGALGEGAGACKMGRIALQDAQQLGNSAAGCDSALLLYVSAIRLLGRAELLRSGDASKDDPSPVFLQRLMALPVLISDGDLPLASLFGSGEGDLYLAELDPRSKQRLLLRLDLLARRLAGPIERDLLRLERLRWARAIRVGLLVLMFATVVGVGFVRVFNRPNLALHRPVKVSDRDPVYGVDPAQVVDGDRLNLGFHAGNIAGTNVTVDLGAVTTVSRVEVFNRTSYQDRATPLTLQVSDDGETFRSVARREQHFQRWTARLPRDTRARYVRLVHESAECFHLAEIEIY